MALGRYSKIDGRKSSSNYCSTVTLVVFVALCLVGVWLMTSSSVVPLQSVDTSQDSKSEVKTVVSEGNEINNNNDDNTNSDSTTNNESNTSNESNTKQFEDNPGDLPDDATKGDDNVSLGQDENNSNSDSKNDKEVHEKTPENGMEEKLEEKPAKQSVEEGSTDDASKTGSENGEGAKEDGESKASQKDGETGGDGDDGNSAGQGDSDKSSNGNQSDSNEVEKKSDESSNEAKDGNSDVEAQKQDKEGKKDGQGNSASNEMLPSGAQSELLNETSTQNGAFSTQAAESKNEKETQTSSEPEKSTGYKWKVCNVTAGSDYIPCLDNLQAIHSLRSTKHYEHRERHCPEDPPTCLVPLPEGYQKSIEWPTSREKIWYHNVPHTKLAEVKGHQNWVKVSGEYLTFPGGGTQFKHGALHYIDFIQQVNTPIVSFHYNPKPSPPPPSLYHITYNTLEVAYNPKPCPQSLLYFKIPQ